MFGIDEHMIAKKERQEEERNNKNANSAKMAKSFNMAARTKALFQEMRVDILSRYVIYFEGALSKIEREEVIASIATDLKIHPSCLVLCGLYPDPTK